jgi:hypothetical protein
MAYRFLIKKPASATPVELKSGVRFHIEETPVAVLISAPSGSHLLSAPRWVAPAGGDSFGHRELARLQVDAAGLDGRLVRFVVERLEGDTWKKIDSAHADVVSGVATAEIPAMHAGDLDAAQLRFRCELL